MYIIIHIVHIILAELWTLKITLIIKEDKRRGKLHNKLKIPSKENGPTFRMRRGL